MSERYIELIKDTEPGASFGFNIKGGLDVGCPVYIWRVEQGTIADRQGIKSGDEILRANGIDFTNIIHSDALKVLKSQNRISLVMRTTQPTINVGDFRGEFYTWVDKFGNPVNSPKESEIIRAPTRLVDLQIDPGQNLGLMIRGGCEYGLGIYVTGVDVGSVAERVGLQRGDEILQVNSRPFTNITHDKAVQTLKSCRKMTLTVAHVGKIPADLTYDGIIKDDEFDSELLSVGLLGAGSGSASSGLGGGGVGGGGGGGGGLGLIGGPSSSSAAAERLLGANINSIMDDKSTSVLQMIEEKARTVLTKSEHSRFTFYRLEYSQGFLPICTFVRILLELLSTHEKYTLLTEVREIIRAEDRPLFDELIYKPAGLFHLNSTDSGDTPFPMNSSMDGQGGGRLENGGGGGGMGCSNNMVNNIGGGGGPGGGGVPIVDNFSENPSNGGDLIYLRELRGSTGMNNQQQGMMMGGGNMGCNNNGGQMGGGGGGTNSDRVPNDCNMPPGVLVKNDQQHLQHSQNSPAVRFRVRCQKLKPTLGITIEGGTNTPHRLARIINVSADGSAAASNLKPGQVLLSVDGKKLDGLLHEDIARYITECYNDNSKHFIDFIVVENKSNLVVLGGGGGGGVGGGGGGMGNGNGNGSGGSGGGGHSPLSGVVIGRNSPAGL